MRKPSVFVSSASLILTDYLPAGEGLISYNLLKHIANTNKYNFNVFAPEIKIRNDLKGINIFNPGKYSFFPAPEEYSYLRQWNSYSGKIRKIYEKGLFESDIIHHMLPFNFNQSYSPVLDNPLIIGPVFHPWTGISDEEYSVT